MIKDGIKSNIDALLLKFGTTPEQAGDVYNQLHYSLAMYFVHHGAIDGEALADETMNRVGQHLEKGTFIKTMQTFILGVAKKVLLEVQHQPIVFSLNQLTHLPTLSPDDREAQFAHLEQCLKQLTNRDRDLIIAYYQESNRKQVAKFLRLSIKTLHNKASLLRAKLLACLKAA